MMKGKTVCFKEKRRLQKFKERKTATQKSSVGSSLI
uniref:Uncharacterized protein n=1 Tax=Arundo donax TaxID=35708 RepID=A0A0A9BT49_ARUDO